MKVQLIVVGRVRGALAEVIHDYEARLQHYFRFDVVEVEAGAGGRADPAAVMQAEAERIEARLDAGAEVVVLDRRGKEWSSRQLAAYFEERALHGLRPVALVIGGAWGLPDEFRQRAIRQWSLGAMTLPHELARLIVTEQLYRAGTILRNEPYHKGDDA